MVTRIDNDIIDNCSTIVRGHDDSVVILPTTLFKYNQESQLSIPMSDVDKSIVDNLSKTETVQEFNDNIYTLSPFHTITQAKVVAKTFDSAGQLIWLEANYIETNSNGEDVWKFNLESTYAITREHDIQMTNFSDNSSGSYHYISLVTDFDIVYLLPDDLELFVNNPSVKLTNVGGTMPSGYNDYVPVSEQLVRVNLGRYVTELSNDVDVVYSDLAYETYDTVEYVKWDAPVYYRDANGVPEYDVNGSEVDLHVKYRSGDWALARGQYDDPGIEITVSTVSGSNQITIDDIGQAVVEVGMGIITSSLPVATTITDVDLQNNIITVDNPADSDATSATAYVDNKQILHNIGDPVIGANGEPIVLSNRFVRYNVNIPQLDAKISKSDRHQDKDYIETLAGTMRGYFDVISASKDQLIENTNIFFKPMRTIGKGRFRISKTAVVDMSLELNFHFKVYVEKYVLSERGMTDIIRNTILDILDKHLKTDIVSCTAITDDIRVALGSNITSIDILGINDDIQLQTLIVVDAGTKASLERRLVLEEQGLISLERGLDIEYIVV